MSHYTHLDTPCLSSMNSFYHSPFIAGMAMPESLIVASWPRAWRPCHYRGLQVAWHKNRDEIGACAKFGGNFELKFCACADFVAIFVPSNLQSSVFSSPCQILQDKIGTPFHFWHRSKIFVTDQLLRREELAIL